MRILGIDPGTHRTGYGVVDADGSSIRHVCHGVVTTVTEAPLWERLRTIHDEVVRVVGERRPAELAIERCFVGKNVSSALKLGHTRGAVMVACTAAGLGIFEYSPSEVKMAVTGSGKAEKFQVAEMVRTLLGLEAAAPADASDALAVAICHAHGLRFRMLMEAR